MTPSPDLIQELRASRPAAPAALRARVRELAASDAAPAVYTWTSLRLRVPARRFALVALPTAAALAMTTAGVLGLARSDAPSNEALNGELAQSDKDATELATPLTVPAQTEASRAGVVPSAGAADAIAPDVNRAQQISATLTVEVSDSGGVSDSAQKALDLTERLGGHVVSASVVTGEGANAAITLRVPAAKVQEAIVGLSALGEIVSQQVSIQDLQATLDQLERRERSVRAQIAVLVARLESEPLDAETKARLQARLQNLRAELRTLRRGQAGTRAEARMATIQLTVVTEDSLGAAPVPSRLDRTLDEALNVLVWEGVVALAILIVAAPFALVAAAALLGHRLYRRREDERLLAT
jgi:Domain of unknown function (DUF4349)